MTLRASFETKFKERESEKLLKTLVKNVMTIRAHFEANFKEREREPAQDPV